MADNKNKQPVKVTERPQEKAPKVVEINPNAGKTIDERMADLLADHKRMGAR